MSELSESFEKTFFLNEVNKFTGSGGEILVKGEENAKAPATRIDIGDRLIGIGITHAIESMSRTPGPDSFRPLLTPSVPAKVAARVFAVTTKREVGDRFEFSFEPLPPKEYSALVEKVSEGAVRIDPESIPEGTMIVSFLDMNPAYSLNSIAGSPGANWVAATKGERQWNVGIGSDQDYWAASFPSDDIESLTRIPPWVKIGAINFGLSLLPGSQADVKFQPVPHVGPSREPTKHQFFLAGSVVGTEGLDTPFRIGLRTEIMFKPG